MTGKYREITFSDDDVVNPDDFIPRGEYNPYNVRPFLLHDHGFPVAIVFGEDLGDALDIAVDAGKMGRYAIIPANVENYHDDEGISFLGNASEPFDIESLGVEELPIPARSWVSQYNAM